MTNEVKKFAEFFAELAEGLQRVASEKERFAQVVNYDVGAVIASVGGTRSLRERDIDAGFRNFKLTYPRKDIKALLFHRSSELDAEQYQFCRFRLCDYFNIGRIYAQRKYSTVRLGQPQLRRFFQLLHDDCELKRLIHRRRNELGESSSARDAFKEIDFFQNGYIDSYSIYEFVKYYMQRELDPLASTYVVDQFVANQQRIDLEAFLAYFQVQTTGILTPVASSVASIDVPEPPPSKPPTLGKIQKNSPQRIALQRYKSLDKLRPMPRDNESVLDRSDSFERFKDREQQLKIRKKGKIPERYRPKHEEISDSRVLEQQLESSNREIKYKGKCEDRRVRSPDDIYRRGAKEPTEPFEWQHRSKRPVEKQRSKKDNIADKRSPFARKEDIGESKHSTRINHPRNLEYLQQIKVFKQDKSLETLVSEIENVRKSQDTVEPVEEHARYQDYLKAKSKSRVRSQLKSQLAKMAELLDQREQIVQQLVKNFEQFNCFHGFNVLDCKEVGFLDFKQFFGSLEQLGIEVSDHSKKMFWRAASKNSRLAFQNYLSLFELKWNKTYYNEVKQRQPLTLDFSGIESWSADLQMAYLKFLASLIDNTVAIRQQKTVLSQLVDTLPERNLPKFMNDKGQPQLSPEDCLKAFGDGITKVLGDMRGDATADLTADAVWRYLEFHH